MALRLFQADALSAEPVLLALTSEHLSLWQVGFPSACFLSLAKSSLPLTVVHVLHWVETGRRTPDI